AELVLTVYGDVDIVIDEDGEADAIAQELRERDIVPAEVDGLEDHARGGVERAPGADADRAEFAGAEFRLGAGVLHAVPDAEENGIAAFIGLGLALGGADDFVFGPDDADLDVGAAEVDADDWFGCGHLGSSGGVYGGESGKWKVERWESGGFRSG